ncbi:MAG TPA: ScyD/ScyE family protein [Pedococcus sp.]|nr:ScyD/ScyE family protein [Pedococcus sp.]
MSASTLAVTLAGFTLPAQAEDGGDHAVTVVASHLDNPRGLAFGSHGDLYIAEAGHGGSLCLGTDPQTGQASCAGLTGSIGRLSHGQVTTVVSQLISIAGSDGTGAEGPVAVSTQGRRLYAQIGGNTSGIPPQAPVGDPVVQAARAQLGQTIAVTGSTWSALAGTGDADYAWTGDHTYLQPDQFPDANPNGIDTMGRTQYVADAGANLIAMVDRHGRVSTLAYLQVPKGSVTDAVPTCVATAPDGSLYVGELLGGDYAPGHARVWRIANGQAKVKWTGFTGIQGCGFDRSGNFYATEFQAHGMFGPDPSGDVVKVTPWGHRTTLGAGSLFFPSGFAYRDGAVYVSNWSIMPAQNAGPTGEVVRIPVG